MPFMGRDWRSPGEAWVKTESLGWQRMKIIESQLYLGACHQNHPACSWPPRSQFGQHMANNCTKVSRQNNVYCDREVEIPESRSSCGLASCSGSSGGESSSASSSASTSPTGTPEKNSSSRHIHPIAISSPYGRYSTLPCCAHHSHATDHQDNCSNNARSSPYDCIDACMTRMPRSLSRETLVDLNCGSAAKQPTLTHNKSVPDFRAARFTCDHRPGSALEKTAQCPVDNDGHNEFTELSGNCESVSPILLEDGVRNDRDESPSHHGSKGQQGDGSASSSPTVRSPPSQETDRPCQLQGSCCCCRSSPSPSSGKLGHQHHHHHHHHHHHILQEPQTKTAPHCRISVRTREVAMHNTISEAFYRLDFYNAIHDIRRFNYICKLLHLLITQNLTSLSGCATRVLFTMLEQVAWEVSSNKRNIHVIRNLLEELRLTIQKYYCWGRPIGSSLLWQQHFETIERISQIVNGIELSPPKDGSYKVTFNHLPVEMIREILLRLSDYRDLVSSARASPVMQSMVEDQCIWQKLCRYHFTDQQLKLALENKENLVGARRRTLRGIKYARTTTADGRSSYRKPVTHKQSSSSSSSSSSLSTTTRQQLEETANRRNPNTRRNSSGSKSSQVTDAVKIFDRANRLAGGHSPSDSSDEQPEPGSSVSEKENQQQFGHNSSRTKNDRPVNPNRHKPAVDWEHVFHQLRKRFDLKEEYADCLLLCRHCRCLFWKSIGHPCIKSDDFEQENPGCRMDAQRKLARRDDSIHGPNQSNLSSSSGERSSSCRPTVASLSRNFDRQVPQGGANVGENVDLPNATQRVAAASITNRNQNDINVASGGAEWQRRPLGNLNAQLRNRNANQLLDAREPVANNHRSGPSRREELVPKHVTITPQAFLKFFSL